MWVTEHSGIKGNEKADQQAKNATKYSEIWQLQESTYDDIKDI